jgi:molecular chaperone Hsp33
MNDYLIRGIDKLGRLRILVASTTNLVEEASKMHETSPTATAALGRSLTAAAMMGITMKNDNDTLTLKINGGGPIGNILVVAKNQGKVKGYVDYPEADVPPKSKGKLDVGRLVGNNGMITTIMDLGLKEPYIGQANMVSGEIAEDLANFYLISDQQPSAVSLGVLVSKDKTVLASGGYIIQLLPHILDEDITKIENALATVEPVSTLIAKGMTPEEIMFEVLKDFDMEVLDKVDLHFECDCSREKIENVLISLGKKEIREIIEEDGEAEVVCQYCNKKYAFNKDDLSKILIDL